MPDRAAGGVLDERRRAWSTSTTRTTRTTGNAKDGGSVTADVPQPADPSAAADAAASGAAARAGHVPVMQAEVVRALAPPLRQAAAGRPAVAVDLTLGLAGHLLALLRACGEPPAPADGAPAAIIGRGALRRWRPDAAVVAIGVDRDPEALAEAAVRLSAWAPVVRLVHATSDELPEILSRLGLDGADAVLADLGVSSLQLDSDRRGFSYARDVALDMRMDSTAALDAATVVNTYPVEELSRVLRAYGEERHARRIATRIVSARATKPLTSTRELADLVAAAYPRGIVSGGHPAKRTFQALRIEVNDELGGLARTIPAALDALRPGGRLAVLAYHSLEDRIVKQGMASAARADVPEDLPFIPDGHGPRVRLLTRGAGRPGEDEVATNPRAGSARFRVAERFTSSTSGVRVDLPRTP